MPETTTYVYDAEGAVLGRLASAVADLLQKAARDGREDKVLSLIHISEPTRLV